MTDTEHANSEPNVDSRTWRKFTLDVVKNDGTGNVTVTLLRPASWLVEESERTTLALLQLATEEAEVESDSIPAWVHVIDDLIYHCTPEAWFNSGEELFVWVNDLAPTFTSANPFVGVTLVAGNLGMDQVADVLEEQAFVERLVAEVQAGDGVGTEIWLEMPELGAVGFATVVANEPTPDIADGPGQVVTATFRHDSAKVLDLTFSPTGELSSDSRLFPIGQPQTGLSSYSLKSQASSLCFGVTSAHPFWSVTVSVLGTAYCLGC